jgi:hypothetical protein
VRNATSCSGKTNGGDVRKEIMVEEEIVQAERGR